MEFQVAKRVMNGTNLSDHKEVVKSDRKWQLICQLPITRTVATLTATKVQWKFDYKLQKKWRQGTNLPDHKKVEQKVATNTTTSKH